MPSHKGHGSTLQQQQEFMQWQMLSSAATGEQNGQEGREAIKVHMGFCVESCLVQHLMVALGEGGMWG